MKSTRALLALGSFALFLIHSATGAAQPGLAWKSSETSVGLFKEGKPVWEFHYGTNQATKPFFHPVALPGGSSISWQSPPDHPWHYGLWFSWKYLNGVNYWEESTNRQCEGSMTWRVTKAETNADFSARIDLTMDYRPRGATEPLLTEQRVVSITAPAADGSYYMDWNLQFKAGSQKVKFDRTPLPGEPGGQSWGGYAGLSIRLAKELTEGQAAATADLGAMQENRYRFSASAADFNGKIDGVEAGVAFMDHPSNLRFPTRWYAIVDPKQPFWYLNAAWIQQQPFELSAGETLTLHYRVAVHPGRWNSARLDAEQKSFAKASLASTASPAGRILVYTKNGQGYVHDNIKTSVETIRQLGAENGFAVDVSDDPASFTDSNLKQYQALVFDNTNNGIFDNDEQKAALQRYIRAGGGFAAIHSACGSERQWPWFWSLLGGKFVRHPQLQPFTIKVRDHAHPSTAHLGETWAWTDEFYFMDHLNPDLHVLLSGDRSALVDPQKDTNFGEQIQGESPLSWCHSFEGGRAWYTALGHRSQDYANPAFRKHLLGGILWAMGNATSN